MRVAGLPRAGFSPGADVRPAMPGAGGRDEEDEALEDEEWVEPADRDPFRDHKIAKKNAERAYREAKRHNAKADRP
jgi:hypothetical protein